MLFNLAIRFKQVLFTVASFSDAQQFFEVSCDFLFFIWFFVLVRPLPPARVFQGELFFKSFPELVYGLSSPCAACEGVLGRVVFLDILSVWPTLKFYLLFQNCVPSYGCITRKLNISYFPVYVNVVRASGGRPLNIRRLSVSRMQGIHSYYRFQLLLVMISFGIWQGLVRA